MIASRSERVRFEDIVTKSKRLSECIEIARIAARTDSSILILGETGVGKTLFAFAIHNDSARSKGPLVNCSTVSDSLLESELFGHTQGAFTSADRDRRGKFELAHGGTLFLDEIGNMTGPTQAKILRAVEDKEFERIGGEETIRADCRIVAATNLSLDHLLDSGRFRADLYYRLSEVVIELPSLRDRREDIPLLVEMFLQEFGAEFGKEVRGLSDVTLNFLLNHGWPGNVRELRNVIRSGVMNATRDTLWIEDLNLRLQTTGLGACGQDKGPEDLSLDAVEKAHVLKVLGMTGGNKKKTCEILRISRPTLDRKLKRFDIP